MKFVKKIWNFVLKFDYWKIPKQEEGTTFGVCCTLIYPVFSLLTLGFLFILFLVPELGGNYEKTEFQKVKLESYSGSVDLDLTIYCAVSECLFYSKSGAKSKCEKQIPKIISRDELVVFKFCYDTKYFLYTLDNKSVDYKNALYFAAMSVTAQEAADVKRVDIVGPNQFKYYPSF
jgi:hypothetical protein